VNERPSPAETELASARNELKRIQARTATARSQLARALLDVEANARRVASDRLTDVLEVNEQLLISSIRLRQAAETAELALKEALRSGDVDALTQLPNRLVLRNRLSHAIAHARRNGSQVALLFIDLTDFKRINDTFGHGVGDDVLKETASRLAASLRAEDMVSRLGGDEFVILLDELSDVSDAMTVAEKVIANLGAPCSIRGHALQLAASIGISLYPGDGEDADTLLDRADAAMYAARRLRVSSFVYDDAICAPDDAPGTTGKHAVRAPQVRGLQGDDVPRQLRSHLREVNEQLLLSTLSAQHLQAAAEAALRKQKEVLAVVAHELRNPLTPMRMAAGMLGAPRPSGWRNCRASSKTRSRT
jgi:diguanylate cyclase (GGDEF)-like protein